MLGLTSSWTTLSSCTREFKPGVAIGEQTPYDLMWMTEPFLSIGGQLGKTVVMVTRSRNLVCQK